MYTRAPRFPIKSRQFKRTLQTFRKASFPREEGSSDAGLESSHSQDACCLRRGRVGAVLRATGRVPLAFGGVLCLMAVDNLAAGFCEAFRRW